MRATTTEPCPNNPSITITDVVNIELAVAVRDDDRVPTRLTGEQTTSAPQAARCGPGSTNEPVTYAYEIDRTS